MKIKIEVECSAKEAREFCGLPDLEDLQEAVLQAAKQKIVDNVQELDVAQLAKMWIPAGLQNMEKWQDAFWQMTKPKRPDDD